MRQRSRTSRASRTSAAAVSFGAATRVTKPLGPIARSSSLRPSIISRQAPTSVAITGTPQA